MMTLKDQINRLNIISTNLIFGVNDVHQSGFDNYNNKANSFFATSFITNQSSQTLIYQITGNQTLNGNAIIGENGNVSLRNKKGEIVNLSYTANEKINDVIERI